MRIFCENDPTELVGGASLGRKCRQWVSPSPRDLAPSGNQELINLKDIFQMSLVRCSVVCGVQRDAVVPDLGGCRLIGSYGVDLEALHYIVWSIARTCFDQTDGMAHCNVSVATAAHI